MANNRMFLVYRPSGTGVFLGKRMAWGWYAVPDDIKERLETLFNSVEKEGARQDDFALALEDARDAPSCLEIVKYGEQSPEGLRMLETRRRHLDKQI